MSISRSVPPPSAVNTAINSTCLLYTSATPGGIWAEPDMFKITIHGKGGHGATPEQMCIRDSLQSAPFKREPF